MLIITLFLTAQNIKAQSVVLDANGVTVKWTGTTVPSPYFVQASPRGTLEWFAIVDNSTLYQIAGYTYDFQSGITYFTPPGSSAPIPFNNIVTTLITDMSSMFNASAFNQPIGSWDVSNVTDMSNMFTNASAFNQPIDSWDVSNVTDMRAMFYGATFNLPIESWNVSNVTDMSAMFYQALAFNQPIGSWNVSSVTNMSFMFSDANDFNQPIGSWNVSSVTNMFAMFQSAYAFNQPIGSWNVSNVTDMSAMFSSALAFNQPIGFWNVSSVTNMNSMFQGTNDFNQPIDSWNVSNVTDMSTMFNQALAFNQPIGSWNVSSVTNMNSMFSSALAFNQPIGFWNVSSVTNMNSMFSGGMLSSYVNAFNQPIGSWDVSNVTSMAGMFSEAIAFNQNIGSWNVSNVTEMGGMFSGGQLSTANYDALLIGWSTIGSNETPLKSNVNFDGGNSYYCNGTTARASIISTYGWAITDAGLNCALDTEEFDTNSLKLYPNPVLSILNIQTPNDMPITSFRILDLLGKIIIEQKTNSNTINTETLSKGLYILEVFSGKDKFISKFIKE